MPLWSNTSPPTWVPTANGESYNIFPTAEGHVLRHYKGGTRYWDEIIARQEGLLEASAANIRAVAFLSNTNYAVLTITSGVGNGFSYQYNTRAAGNVFQQSNSTTYTCNATVANTGNVVPYNQLAIDTSNIAAFANGSTLYQANSTANVAVGVLFFANSTVLRVQNVTGTFNTSNTVQANSTLNAAVSAVTSNITGTVTLLRLEGRFTTANVIQNGTSNLTVSVANNFANGTIGVFYDEKVNVAGGPPSMNITSSNTTNAICSFDTNSSHTNRLIFTYTANATQNSSFAILGQTLNANSATFKDEANASVTSNILFANSVVMTVAFGGVTANVWV